MIKLKWLRGGNVARMEKMRNIKKYGRENLEGRAYLVDLGVEGRIILIFTLKK